MRFEQGENQIARILPEIEFEIKMRDERVQSVSFASHDERNNRLQFNVYVDSDHFGQPLMPFSFSHLSMREEGVRGIVYKILWVMNHHSRKTRYREAITG